MNQGTPALIPLYHWLHGLAKDFPWKDLLTLSGGFVGGCLEAVFTFLIPT